MSASLVGSEMCIRDRPPAEGGCTSARACSAWSALAHAEGCGAASSASGCLLYTSDAADDM
eukprot:12162865-Alexandrium_andersonii.AAC.1